MVQKLRGENFGRKEQWKTKTKNQIQQIRMANNNYLGFMYSRSKHHKGVECSHKRCSCVK